MTIPNVDGKNSIIPVASATAAKGVLVSTKENQVTNRTEAYIETESYLNNQKERNSFFFCDDFDNMTAADKQRKAEFDAIQNVYKNTERTISPDGSVKFQFKGPVNVEAFKKAYGIADENLREYLMDRHEKGIKKGTITVLPQGNQTPEEVRTNFNASSNLGDTISYSDGMKGTKVRGGLFNNMYERPDYTGMSFTPEDNDKLFVFDSSFFRE